MSGRLRRILLETPARTAGRAARGTRRAVPVLFDFAGFGLISVGVWNIYEPAGLIAAGAACVLAGIRFSSSD